MSADASDTDGNAQEERATGRPSDFENNLKSRSTWLRLVYMIVLGALYALSRLVVFAVVVLQFLWVLFTSETNQRLKRFGHSLAVYTAEVIDYLCYVSDVRPFPFDRDWPDV